MKALRVLVLSLLFIACHAALPAGPPPPCVHEHVRMSWRGDVDFTTEERAGIEAAMLAWREASGGLVEHTVTWDLDFKSTMSIVAAWGKPMVMRMESWMPPVHTMDEGPEGRTYTLGWKSPYGDRLYLVADRITAWRAITMHELGHAVGMGHLPQEPLALMSPKWTGQKDFTDADRAALKRLCLAR